nr:hypothetical protein [Tanacetum cinerariifolium]
MSHNNILVVMISGLLMTLINLNSTLAKIKDQMTSITSLCEMAYQIEDLSESNEEFSSIDDDSFSVDDIDYVEASPSDFELVSLEVMEIVIPE